MSPPKIKLTSPISLVVDAILVFGFFCVIYWAVAPHVPSTNPMWIHFWGGLTAACMSSVFWLAVQMFRVVFAAQRLARQR